MLADMIDDYLGRSNSLAGLQEYERAAATGRRPLPVALSAKSFPVTSSGNMAKRAAGVALRP